MKAPRRVDSKGSLSKNPFRDNSYVSIALQDLLLGDSGCKKGNELISIFKPQNLVDYVWLKETKDLPVGISCDVHCQNAVDNVRWLNVTWN